MGLVPTTFTTETGAIASYDFNDFAAGTGIQTFLAFSRAVPLGTGNSYAISTAMPYSNSAATSISIDASTPAEIYFDSEPFLLPRIVKGTATVNFSWRVSNSSGTSNNFPQVSLWKYDSSSSTASLMGSASGSVLNSLNTTGSLNTSCLQIRNIDQASGGILSGEQLRLGIAIYATNAGNNQIAHICHDPQNRAISGLSFDTTKCAAFVPFLLDA